MNHYTSICYDNGYPWFAIHIREINHKNNAKDLIRKLYVWWSCGLYLGNYQKMSLHGHYAQMYRMHVYVLKISVFLLTRKTFYLTSCILNNNGVSHSQTIFLVLTLETYGHNLTFLSVWLKWLIKYVTINNDKWLSLCSCFLLHWARVNLLTILWRRVSKSFGKL